LKNFFFYIKFNKPYLWAEISLLPHQEFPSWASRKILINLPNSSTYWLESGPPKKKSEVSTKIKKGFQTLPRLCQKER
jgi:hypothetical protein